MAVIQDRITVTFYGEDEVRIADKFRQLLRDQGKSLNDTLKELVIRFCKESTS